MPSLKNTALIAFSRNERTHPNFVSQAPEIQIFCEDCKLEPPLGFFRGFGLVVEYIVPGDEAFSTPELFSFAYDRRREEIWGTLGQALG